MGRPLKNNAIHCTAEALYILPKQLLHG